MMSTGQFVQTRISVPAEVYARATRRAKELGTSRSAFFTEAVEKELARVESSVDIIDQTNAVVEDTEVDTRGFVATSSRRTLAKEDATKW